MKYYFVALIILFSAILFPGCSKKDDPGNSNISQNDSTALLGILEDISKSQPIMIDIAPIPIDQEMVNLNNDQIDQFLEMFKRLNNLIKNPQDIDQTGHKSAAYGTYTKNCETNGMFTECIYEEDHGEYKITVDMTTGPVSVSVSVYYTGTYEGIFYGKMYEKQSYTAPLDGKSFIWIYYRDPVPIESAGEPLFSNSMIYSDAWSVYTPWGNEHNLNVLTTCTNYIWDDLKKENHEELILTHEQEGKILKIISGVWSENLEEIYTQWVGTYNFKEHSGEWCSFDEDGEVKKCGDL